MLTHKDIIATFKHLYTEMDKVDDDINIWDDQLHALDSLIGSMHYTLDEYEDRDTGTDDFAEHNTLNKATLGVR